MKKILLFLLPLFALAQNPTNFPYGIKNTVAPTDSTPAYFTTAQVDGVHKKTPAALVAFKSDLPVSYAVIVYVNTTSPLTANIFDDENPPTTNDNAFKADVDNLYIGTDASSWVWNGSTYVTKIIPSSSNFNLIGASVDAGSNKSDPIIRSGTILTNGELWSYTGLRVSRNGSNTATMGGNALFSNAANSEANMFQLNASNGLDLWNFTSSTWTKRFTFSSAGDLTVNKDLYIGNGTDASGLKLKMLNGNYLRTFDPTDVGNVSSINFGCIGGGGDLRAHGKNFIILSEGGVEKARFTQNKALLLNTTSDNGIDKLQVNGTVSSGTTTLGNTPPTANNQLTRKDYVDTADALKAPLASPTFTGTPLAPTATVGTNTTQIATTAFVKNAVDSDTKWTVTGIDMKNNNTGNTTIGTPSLGFSYNGGLGVQGKIATSTGFRGNIYADLSEYPMIESAGNGNVKFSGKVRLKNYTVATLPTGTAGDTAYCTDLLAPTYMATAVGGGTIVWKVFYDGTSWKVD